MTFDLGILAMLGHWLDTATKRVAAILALLGVLYGGFTALDRYVAKAVDVERLQLSLNHIMAELKIGQLENRRAILRTELRSLRVFGATTSRDRERLELVADEIRDVEKEIDRLREIQARRLRPVDLGPP